MQGHGSRFDPIIGDHKTRRQAFSSKLHPAVNVKTNTSSVFVSVISEAWIKRSRSFIILTTSACAYPDPDTSPYCSEDGRRNASAPACETLPRIEPDAREPLSTIHSLHRPSPFTASARAAHLQCRCQITSLPPPPSRLKAAASALELLPPPDVAHKAAATTRRRPQSRYHHQMSPTKPLPAATPAFADPNPMHCTARPSRHHQHVINVGSVVDDRRFALMAAVKATVTAATRPTAGTAAGGAMVVGRRNRDVTRLATGRITQADK
ncbi:hypothetical protein ACLOJK_036665 [Asimina triloba]